jgi:hypothetical protein
VTAWRNLSAYPDGHPARAAGLRNAHARLCALLRASGGLELGVTREGLLHAETSFAAPHARALAQALHVRNVAVLRFEEGVDPTEVETLLRLLGPVKPGAEPRPLELDLTAAGIGHVSVVSLDYSALATTEAVSPILEEPASLWAAIVQSLLTGKVLAPHGVTPLSGETYTAEGLASLLASSAAGTDSAGLEGVLGSVKTHLGRAHGPAWTAAVHQLGELVRALPKDIRDLILQSALSAAAGDERVQDLVPLLTSLLEPDDLLRALRQLSVSGVKLSAHALKLIHTLSADARRRAEQDPSSEAVTRQVVDELTQLFHDEDVDRYNPDDHQGLLDQVAAVDLTAVWPAAAEDPTALGASTQTLTEEAIRTTTTQVLLDLVASGDAEGAAGPLARLQQVFGDALAAGDMAHALGLVDALRALSADAALTASLRAAVTGLMARLASESIPRILQSGASAEETALALRELVARLGAAATAGLLESLSVEKDKSRRRRLFDALVSLGLEIAPQTRRLLTDPRWYVVRNMVALLRAVGDRSAIPDLRRCAEHPDIRVRLEAIKTLLGLDPSVPRQLLERALNDPDPKIAEAAVSLCGQCGIREARAPLLAMLQRWDFLGARLSLRLKALRALADLGDPTVLPELGRFFRNWWFPVVQLEERRAAYKLLEAYPEESRRAFMQKGLRSRDLYIRRVCERLGTSPAQAPQPRGEAFDVPAPPPAQESR